MGRKRRARTRGCFIVWMWESCTRLEPSCTELYQSRTRGCFTAWMWDVGEGRVVPGGAASSLLALSTSSRYPQESSSCLLLSFSLALAFGHQTNE